MPMGLLLSVFCAAFRRGATITLIAEVPTNSRDSEPEPFLTKECLFA
jgi:hypothetical protein